MELRFRSRQNALLTWGGKIPTSSSVFSPSCLQKASAPDPFASVGHQCEIQKYLHLAEWGERVPIGVKLLLMFAGAHSC
jgi:hypothetical protein